MQSSITIITTGDYAIITLNHGFPPLPYQFATPCDLLVMMQVIRVCVAVTGVSGAVSTLSCEQVCERWERVCRRISSSPWWMWSLRLKVSVAAEGGSGTADVWLRRPRGL